VATLNATAASLLGFLHSGPKTGWDLVATAQRLIGPFWSITQSQVYRELAAMAAAGLVEAGARGSRDRRPYAITEAGRAAFAAWVKQPPGEELIRFPLLLTVSFGAHVPPDVLAAHVAQHREIHAKRLAHYQEVKAEAEAAPPGHGPDIYAVATLDFGMRYERAALEWFDALPPEIRGGAGKGKTDDAQTEQAQSGGTQSGGAQSNDAQTADAQTDEAQTDSAQPGAAPTRGEPIEDGTRSPAAHRSGASG